mmetsp:Transcript_16518/g.22831  ORF Transcript_16518/g.22831 Transcript_16518/m.22831 type:complete len:586 (-) Transcript_16518:251-2008(-)|eukprot:CAMPEP_0196590614 /NCGR_PEP_ID=MMETSP1081-20130531/67064_1 /TAXON_ID=36882 /ORGANISM="Pyramimonas amylifera, Strain CCMP720" /LENGTH=585 /DNA_ID=CAMNT_0041913765 /DNA_START=105 /DNA_END=1862 /DNA_ORIENTATION=-
MSSISYGGKMLAAVVAGGSAGGFSLGFNQVAHCAKENPPPQFDPEALERGVKALREISSSSHAKQVFDLAKKQEDTKLQEMKKEEAMALQYAKQAETEHEKVHWEEMRKTQQTQAQQKAQLSRYEDELARKRMEVEHEARREQNAELVSMQEQASKRQEVHRRTVEEQIQFERRKTAEQEAEIERETLRQKALFEAEGRIKEARDNEDVTRRQMMVRLKAEQEKALQIANAVFTNIGSGTRELLGDPNKLALSVGALTALAVGIYGAREGSKLGFRLLERYLGQPSLVRETSKPTMNPATWRFVRALLAPKRPEGISILGDVVLEPQLDTRVRQLASATMHWKRNNAPFKNAMFYGPPGTGKTMAARQMAKYSGLDFAIMTGGDVAPLGADAVTRLHELFDWAQSSRKGMLLFIDEADSFLGVRGREGTTEGVRAAMNALLARTGDQSTSFGLILATNRPSDLDEAAVDRMDEMLEFALPGPEERMRIFKHHLLKYLQPPSAGFFSSQPTKVEMEGIDDDVLSEVADLTEGFSGRQLAKLAASVQGAVFGSKEVKLTPDLLRAVLKYKVDEHITREKLAHGELER